MSGTGGAYAADLAALDAVVEHAGQVGVRIEQRLAEIDRRIRALHVSWTGEAAATHRTAHARLMADAQQLRESLRALRAVVAGAHANYTSAVEANTAMWSIG